MFRNCAESKVKQAIERSGVGVPRHFPKRRLGRISLPGVEFICDRP
jgi:hypothetical protein